MAKRAKYEGFIDNLPDSILCHILSFLSARDAVRTSVLSRRWRYLFTSSISNIDLDFNSYRWPLPVTEEFKNSFKKFVDRLFFNPEHLRLERIRVSDHSLGADFLTIYNWLCAALWRGVKEIELCLYRVAIPELPSLLVTCPSLVKLILFISDWEMKVPTNVCLPNLRTLHLSYIRIVDGCSFLRLISCCPVLEDLSLFNCSLDGTSELNIHSLSLKRLVLDFDDSVDMSTDRGFNDFDHTIVIDAPSLVYFEYFCLAAAGYTLNMGSLETADITIFHYSDADRERSVGLLQGICNAQVLRLSVTDFDAPLFRLPPDPVLAFHNLVELVFMNPCEDSMVSVIWTLEFLRCIPNLKTFTLVLGEADIKSESLPEEVPSCLLHHLKEISIIHYRGVTHMFEIVGYFLKHASVLEKLAMSRIDALQECRSSVMEKLSFLPKKSKKCKFEID